GLTGEVVREAMRLGVEAACRPGVVRISAGNYGGRLGQYHIRLWELWE
ncbi:MAG: formylmethanofuran--tetrahydromethanopterin N-formyltransferase, partial [Chloroflexi bacterium]|nr:formylmethanofuran--tetrahydromethanopterin N-formyltransferase [Chloroflexota bacterium]